MDEYESLSHTTWTCKYHVVFIPKCRRKALYQELRRHLGEVFRKLAIEGRGRASDGRPRSHAAIDPAEIRGSQGQELDPLGAGLWRAKAQLCVGQQFWARGFLVNTVDRDEEAHRTSLHLQSRERRSEAGTDELVALTTPPFSGSKLTGRVSDPSYRFERFAS
jgi:putative transposase